MQSYLNKLENWFNKWRFQVCTNKCSYAIYSSGNFPTLIKHDILKLKIFDEVLKVDYNPKYLGMIVDKRLGFNMHTEEVKNKCQKCFDILYNLSTKNWSLDENSKLQVYKCLIRS